MFGLLFTSSVTYCSCRDPAAVTLSEISLIVGASCAEWACTNFRMWHGMAGTSSLPMSLTWISLRISCIKVQNERHSEAPSRHRLPSPWRSKA